MTTINGPEGFILVFTGGKPLGSYPSTYLAASPLIIGTAGSAINPGTQTSPGRFTATVAAARPVYQYGSLVGLTGTGATIVNEGTVTNTYQFGVGIFGFRGGYIGNSGLVRAPTYGIWLGPNIGGYYGGGTVVNSGTLTNFGTGGYPGRFVGIKLGYTGVAINSGTITDSGNVNLTGIQMDAGGYVKNTGIIAAASGFSIEMALPTAGTVINSGTIAQGVALSGEGNYLASVTNQASGKIAGGVSIEDGGTATVVNAGTITSTLSGGDAGDGVSIGGYVGSEPGSGVALSTAYMDNSGLITATAGSGTAGGPGLLIGSTSATVVNSGTIVASHYNGIKLATGSGGATVTNTGYIKGTGFTYDSSFGVVAGGPVDLANLGTIVNGVGVLAGGTVVNQGLIVGPIEGGATGSSSLTIENSGTVTGGIGVGALNGLYVGNSGLIDNRVNISGTAGTLINTGRIVFSAGGTAVSIGTAGKIVNFGSIAVGGTYGGAIVANGAGAMVTNASSGYLNGGIQVTAAAGRVFNQGTVVALSSYLAGVSFSNGGYLDNSGIILAGLNGIVTNFGGAATTVVNSGAIQGKTGARMLTVSGATLSNSGTIVGTGTSGIGFAGTSSALYNAAGGLITGAHYGVNLYLGTGNVTNRGTIAGGIGIAIGATSTAGNTIVNFGTIVGTNGTAVQGGGGDLAFVEEAGAQVQGAFTNFHPGDTIDLAGVPFSANSVVNLKPGDPLSQNFVLSVYANGQATNIPLANPAVAGDVFTLSNDGSGGTLISEAPGAAPFAVTDPLMTNSAGALVFDQVTGGQIAFTTIGGLGPEWGFEGTGFFLDNGNGDPGFLIQDTGTVEPGALFVGEVVNGSATFTPVGGLGPEWQFEGDADFLGTGQSEFLIRNAGTVEPGMLDLGQVANGTVQYTPIGGLGLEWEFDGTGDFLGDGNQGFLIRNDGSVEPGALDVGEIANGAVNYTPIGGVGPEWNFEGTGDFLGDGHTGFLIWNSGTVDPGALAIGEVVNGGLQFTDIGGLGPEWQFVGTGNYLDSTKTDFLLLNTGTVDPGALVVGSVSGTTGNATVHYTLVGGVGPEWTFHNTSPALIA